MLLIAFHMKWYYKTYWQDMALRNCICYSKFIHLQHIIHELLWIIHLVMEVGGLSLPQGSTELILVFIAYSIFFAQKAKRS